MSEVRDRWEAMSPRRRGALLRAVRRGDVVGEPDRPVAVAVAEKELDRLTRVVRPGRVLLWRVLHALAAVLFGLLALAFAVSGAWVAAAVAGAMAAVFGSSALFARRRLDRQVGRLAAARERNAPHGTPAHGTPAHGTPTTV